MTKPLAILLAALASASLFAGELAITMDDPETGDAPLFSPVERNAKILAALAKHHAKAMLFVCGKRIDGKAGKALLKTWNDHGHELANHSYSHLSLNAEKVSLETYEADFLRAAPLLSGLSNAVKFYRFPFLKEGDTAEKRDGMRELLKEKGYRNGAVTIDASDWAVNERLVKRLKKDPKADLTRYRNFYLAHIADRAEYYDRLARRVFGREIKHTLLIHHNLLNALFLDDLLALLESKGWKLIPPSEAYEDPIFSRAPKTLPAGESIVWGAAKETGKFDKELRYPGEDETYERAGMDRFGL